MSGKGISGYSANQFIGLGRKKKQLTFRINEDSLILTYFLQVMIPFRSVPLKGGGAVELGQFITTRDGHVVTLHSRFGSFPILFPFPNTCSTKSVNHPVSQLINQLTNQMIIHLHWQKSDLGKLLFLFLKLTLDSLLRARRDIAHAADSCITMNTIS